MIYSLIRTSERKQTVPISYRLILQSFDWLAAFHLELLQAILFNGHFKKTKL